MLMQRSARNFGAAGCATVDDAAKITTKTAQLAAVGIIARDGV